MHLNTPDAKYPFQFSDIIPTGGKAMDWQKQMNRAMEYIENNLSEKPDYNTAAQFMNCSEWEFRRIFSFLTQIPVSEYIRRRRLTVAVSDIQN